MCHNLQNATSESTSNTNNKRPLNILYNKIKQYLILMLPILLSSMIIYHSHATVLNINYLSFLKPLK